jgi:hypothetical protein
MQNVQPQVYSTEEPKWDAVGMGLATTYHAPENS